MQFTGSISRGKTAEKHNTRECYPDREHTPQNIDTERTGDNIVLVNRPIEDVYRERFGAATEEYNARQVERKHPERQIRDYLEHVRKDKKLQPMYEFVVQVGNMDEHPDAETASAIYREWLDGFRDRFGRQFAVKQAIIHLDEKTAHMHVEVVPCAESKRGLAIQNSMNKAVRQAGFDGYKQMLAGWDEILTEVMERHGIERIAGDREKQMGGVDINTFKQSKALERDIAQKREQKRELTTAIADRRGDLAEVDSAVEDAELRLEGLRRAEKAEAAAVADLDRAIEQAGMEPAAETLGESVRALWTARGDGERETVLAGEVEGLRSRISELEGANQRARERVAELDRGLPRLRERVRELGARLDHARVALREAIEKVREVPRGLSAAAKEMARELGKLVAGEHQPPSRLAQMAKEVARSSEALNASRSHGFRERGRGVGR